MSVMDLWPQDHHRQKRSYEEMSQHASLSPSPMFLGHPAPSLPPLSSLPLDIPGNHFERRRTSHPHNEASRSSQLSTQSMAELQMGQIADVEHRNSRTPVIDLTSDSPESDSTNPHMQRRPQFHRSDALSFEDIIDLTDDAADDDIEIIEARIVREPPPAANAHRRLPTPRQAIEAEILDGQHEMFIPQELNEAERILREPRQHPLGREFITHHHSPFGHVGGAASRFANIHTLNLDDRVSVVFQLGLAGQRMPDLDYHNIPFVRSPRNPPKPQHQPPPAAKPGFTRSPEEIDQIICPACENELVANKVEEGPPAKKPSGRAQSKKDREEHPFWVVRDCGHVYCNKCYQARKPDRKNKRTIFPQNLNAAGKTVPICAVEDCGNEIGDKKHWVGVFI